MCVGGGNGGLGKRVIGGPERRVDTRELVVDRESVCVADLASLPSGLISYSGGQPTSVALSCDLEGALALRVMSCVCKCDGGAWLDAGLGALNLHPGSARPGVPTCGIPWSTAFSTHNTVN